MGRLGSQEQPVKHDFTQRHLENAAVAGLNGAFLVAAAASAWCPDRGGDCGKVLQRYSPGLRLVAGLPLARQSG